MTDEEFVFYETNRERKSAGHGDFHKKRKGGKYVRLPSDHLTAKERKKLNGDCKTYPLDIPRTREEFRELPDEIKTEYLNHLHTKYHVGPSDIAKMMGRSYFTLRKEMVDIGLTWKDAGVKTSPTERTKWEAFCGGETAVEQSPIQVKVAPKQIDFNAVVAWLKESGAKVSLEITWG